MNRFIYNKPLNLPEFDSVGGINLFIPEASSGYYNPKRWLGSFHYPALHGRSMSSWDYLTFFKGSIRNVKKHCLLSITGGMFWRKVKNLKIVIILFDFIFFQAEDGIRDDLVTGVQTCALPICSLRLGGVLGKEPLDERRVRAR